ncbi:MAG TPA: alpha/beta hydrolase [Dehalococcoidia bacterium]|nr:alpha/beta hydrolase [Dehalococcoidia bacterium]
MPYAQCDEINIYYEIEGQGPPLVLGHGGNYTIDMWKDWGYTDRLKNDFQLIMLDFRGHGRSDKINQESGIGFGMADDVIAVLDDIGIDRTSYFGYSMGAMVGFSLATSQHVSRFNSFILGGMTPYEWPEEMIRAINISIEGYKLLQTDPDAYIEWMENLLKRTLSPEEKIDLLSRNAESSASMQSGLLDTPPLSNEELSRIPVPCLIYCGEQDPFYPGAKESVEHIPQGVFISMGGFNHITAITQSDLVIPYIKSFLDVVSERG